jgi:hypothetical protein
VSQHHDWHDDGEVKRFPHRHATRRLQQRRRTRRCSCYSRWSDIQQERGPKHGIVNVAMASKMLHGEFGGVGGTP